MPTEVDITSADVRTLAEKLDELELSEKERAVLAVVCRLARARLDNEPEPEVEAYGTGLVVSGPDIPSAGDAFKMVFKPGAASGGLPGTRPVGQIMVYDQTQLPQRWDDND